MDTITFQRHHFAASLSDDDARELFRTSVRYVEIETFTYCNRKCWFCPNAKIPQRQDKAGNRYMDEVLYLRILDELKSVGYSGQIQFGRYNEPLSDMGIFSWCVYAARKQLPKAYLYTHTNGDFLTRGDLGSLRHDGLNELKIQTYLGNNDHWHDDRIVLRMKDQLESLDLRIVEQQTVAPGFRYMYRTDYPGMLVTIDARNFDAIGTDRGGLLPIRQTPRTAPCLIPFSQMYIDWNGSVVPCCNIRSDIPEHAPHVVANLSDGTSIFQAFAALHGWRKGLMRFGEKSGPCATCRYDEEQVGEESAGELERVYQLAVNQ